MKTWKQIEKEFDEKFHKRIWSIVKQVSPSSYALAESYGTLEGEGPQIYGEMKDYFYSALDEYVRELLWSTDLHKYQELLKQHEENFSDAVKDKE